MDAWNPNQYNRFQSERSQPFWDLAALVDPGGVNRWLDVGCGTGELTRALHDLRSIPYTLGIDSSDKMLAEARKTATPNLFFQTAQIESFQPEGPFDVVFSNAALQWVEDHRELFPRLLNWLAPQGQLAVQMPVNFDHPSHILAERVGEKFGLKVRRTPVLAPEEYAQLFWQRGLRDIQIFVKVYLHPLDSAREVIEWTRGTLLTFYERQMDDAGFKDFLRVYSESFLRLTGEGPYLYPFKRLLIRARKP
ncbi:MAG: methyltransferase domain-containing protein [Bdellovibrionales bacterium]|nr:methyltransferase domain-containing protein [Bdellovibrionales bacterium]